MPESYRIGELAARTGRSVHAIRWYESQGLIPGVARDAGGRRVYGELHLNWLDLMDRLRRTADLPDVPTMVEAGIAGYEVTTWWSFVVPAGTPPAVVSKINADTVKALQSADVRDRMIKQGLEPSPSTPAELDALAKAEFARWSKLIKDIGARAD